MLVSNLAASKIYGSNAARPQATRHTRRKAAIASATNIEFLEKRQLLSGTLALVNPALLPGSDRLIFNYIQNPDPNNPNVVHSQQTLQITDTNSTPLTINSLTLTGPWSLVGATPASYAGMTVTEGAPVTLTIAFTQRSLPAHTYNETNYSSNINGGAAITGSLTVNTSDTATPSKVVTLAGYWQNQSNDNNEPSLQTITNLLAGYQTVINATPTPDLTESNSPPASNVFGSEVVATSWEAADSTTPVSLQELATYRTQGSPSTVYWYDAAEQQSHQLLAIPGNQGQTLLPTLADGSLATASFSPTGAFGLRVDNEYTTDSINTDNNDSGGAGHHFRFFPVLTQTGQAVPNTYIVALDYGIQQVENFDFNDHVFVVSNIRPSGTPATPTGFTATTVAQPVLTWNAVSYTPVVYNVLSSSTAAGPYNLLTTTSGTTYTDTSNPVGTVYYQLVAEDMTQAPVTKSAPATATVTTGPVLQPITINTYSGVPVTFNPLATATDSTGTFNPATVTVTAPIHGSSATVNASNGSITYTPGANFTGNETFTYTVTDSAGHTATAATVTAHVLAVILEPPVTNNYVTTTLENEPISIPILSVDNATTSFNTSTVVFTANTSSGQIVANPDGTVTYTPSTNFVGGDEFQYTVKDNNGQTSNVGVVDINVGTEISSAKGAAKTLVYTDENGTPVTITLNKGVADIYFDGIGTVVSSIKGKTTVAGTINTLRARQITLSGTTLASSLSITGKRKGQVNLGGVSDASPLGSLNAPTANLAASGSTTQLSSSLLQGSLEASATLTATPIAAAGTISLAGVRSIALRSANAATITLGAAGVVNTSVVINGKVTDSSLSSAVPLTTLKATSWTNTNTIEHSYNVFVTAPSIRTLTIGGQFDATLTLNSTGKIVALNSAKIVGAATTAGWNITGNAHSIYLGSASSTWGGLTVTGNLASLVIARGGLTADIKAGSINSLKVAGAISADITTTGNLLSLQAAQLVDALVEVGTTATSVTTATSANIGTALLGTLRLTSRAANTFSDSNVLADRINSITTGQVNAANGGTPEGIAATVIKGAAVTVDNGILHLSAKNLLSNAALTAFLGTKGATLGTFTIDIL